jgi:hypothetical protein
MVDAIAHGELLDILDTSSSEDEDVQAYLAKAW